MAWSLIWVQHRERFSGDRGHVARLVLGVVGLKCSRTFEMEEGLTQSNYIIGALPLEGINVVLWGLWLVTLKGLCK